MKPATRFWVGIYSFTAVIMLIAVGVFILLASQSRRQQGLGRTANAKPMVISRVPEERYALLARFVPPVYQPSAEPEFNLFQQAIEQYAKGDDAGAAAGLTRAAKERPNSVEVRFYLGICRLLTNDRSSGIEDLRRVVAGGNTPYLERARFYLAKALIGERKIPEAKQQLKDLIAMHGELQKQAEVLLSQI